jgi:hypothetical protein
MNKLFSMKKITKTATLFCASLILMASVSSCKKEASTATADTVSEEEAAEAITQSVSAESGGMTAQSSDAVTVTTDELTSLPCGIEYDSSVSKINADGATITYAFNLAWNWMLTCTGIGVPQKINFNIAGSSSYDAPRMSSDDNSTAAFEITGLESSSGEFTLNANYQRNGTQQSKVLNKNSFTSTIIISSADIVINKVTQKITSGTASAAISGASSSGKSFSYSGTITFLGNQKATLTMASGDTYNIAC